MHTVIETAAYLAAAKGAGMSEEERSAVVDIIAADPTSGEIMPGCGGARKLRVARPGDRKVRRIQDRDLLCGGGCAGVSAHCLSQKREGQPDQGGTEHFCDCHQTADGQSGSEVMTKAFDMMMEGLNDAIAYAEGDKTRAQIAVPLDVRAIREATHKTQAEFAAAFHLPIGTVRDWEQRRRQPDAPARVLLSLIAKEPSAIEKLVASACG
jgi:putative transcriptional regulator